LSVLARRPIVAIITPYGAAANNGNWRTASRWAHWLRERYRVRLLPAWCGEPVDALIALHARRSAPSIAAYSQAHSDRPCIVVLTGTDLYRDIRRDESARRSLARATQLVVLNEMGRARVPQRWRAKATVILQSAPALPPLPRPVRRFRAIVVGHLRAEKEPLTAMRAAEQLAACEQPAAAMPIEIVHIGNALDAGIAAQARATTAHCPRYRWLGGRPHGATRRAIRGAHVLLQPSLMEGGAQAVIEAIMGGTPVIASRIDGNVGLLGRDYPGYFPVGNVAACARLLQRAAREQSFYARLVRAARQRAARFAPGKERTAVLRLTASALAMAAATRARAELRSR
jgi:putative glycosyltransferase (TIGR04348 family)